jgi:uncharacterized protein
LKFQPDRLDGVNTVSVYTVEGFGINGQRHAGSLIVPWRGDIVAWAPSCFDDLTREHFDQLREWSPELIIFGSGPKQRFAPPALLQGLIGQRVGVECMDTAAACRTYNVLVTEGRRVLGAFLAA